jgi:hypothetical protein
MDVSFNAIARLVAFVNKIVGETYPETPSIMHSKITANVLTPWISQFMFCDDQTRLLFCGERIQDRVYRSQKLNSADAALGCTLLQHCARELRGNKF